MQVVVHGGAGGVPRDPKQRQVVLDAALEAALGQDTPQAAVIEAVAHLEVSPRFNAGRGGTIQSDGVHRSDAGIMTDDGSIGAVCNLTGVGQPVRLAAAVKEETPHVLLGPVGAMKLASTLDIDTEVDLSTDRLNERFRTADVPTDFAGQLRYVRERFDDEPAGSMDTVGAVARDGTALAAATSTGGRWLALAGRIGDVPQVGCGFYCSSHGAISTTGAGEAIAQTTLARLVERHLAEGYEAQAAATAAMADFERRTNDTAGVIAIDAAGGQATALNSDRMQTAGGQR